MKRFRRFHYLALLPMSILLPLWLTFGRALLGVSGWVLLLNLMLAPIIFGVLVIFFSLIATRPDAQKTRSVGVLDSVLLTALYVIVVLHGFFVVDFKGYDDYGSVATALVGRGVTSFSEGMANFFAIASVLAFAICLTVFTYERIHKAPLVIKLPKLK